MNASPGNILILHFGKELATKLAGHTSWNGVLAEDYLLDHGYVAVRARDVYARLGYVDDSGKFKHLTDVQRQWLTDHYDEFMSAKQREVDKLLDFYDKE